MHELYDPGSKCVATTRRDYPADEVGTVGE